MSKAHEVMFYTDGRHSSVYLYEPPMGVRQYEEPIDELVDLGVDTITYAVGDCSVLLYATKVGERWGHNVDLTDHDIWWRAAKNAKAMIDSGVDPLMLVCRHAQERGFRFLPGLLLNMTHTPHDRVTNCRVADFTTEHAEWQVGPEPDYPEAAHDQPNRLSYAVPEVRANRLAVIRELVSDYPSDGIEINMMDYAPFIARREVAEHTDTMTEWVREIRRVCEAASAAQGQEKRLVVRIAATLAGNKAMGMDLEMWIREGLVDSVIAMAESLDGFEANTSGLREIVRAAHGTNVKVLAGIDATNRPELTREVNYAAAANAYAAGAGGVFFHTYYPQPKRYPYDDAATGRLRFMGYPDLLARQDKKFRLGTSPQPGTAMRLGLRNQLPAPLEPGQRGQEITLEVTDDAADKAQKDELWRSELRVFLQHLMEDDEIRLVWNGEEVPRSAQRWADWIYQLRPSPDHAVNGYRIHVDLNGRLPRVGTNTLRVDVLKKDAQLIHPITVAEVAVVLQYLPHRNALRPDETYID